MGNERVSLKWKEDGGIHYSMLQSPTSSAYVPGEDIKFFSEQDISPTGPTGKSATMKFGMMPRGKRANHNIGNPKNPFAKPASATIRPSVQRRPGIGQGAKSGLAEVARIASSRRYLNTLDERFWEAIQDMSREVAAGIKEHGGVLIIGRVSMMPTPDPDTGIRQAFFCDAYIKDGAKSVNDLFSARAKSNTKPDLAGPQPKQWIASRGYMVLGEYQVFATSTSNARR